jgi:PAS domain S-box-containing protein
MPLIRIGAPWGSSTRFRSSIILRLLAAIFAFSSVVTLSLTALQVLVEYERGAGEIDSRLEEIRNSYLASLGEGLWRLDEQQLQLLLDGILRLPDIRAAEVREISSRLNPVVVTAGRRAGKAVISREYPLLHTIRGVEEQIGVLHVEASLAELYRHLMNTALVILVSQGAKTFLVSFFSIFIFFHLLTRHLVDLANFVGGYDVREPPPPLELDRRARREPDELDKVVVAFNGMCASLQAAYRDAQGAIQGLRESEERLHLALDAATAGIWEWDLRTDVYFWSEGLWELFGLEPRSRQPSYELWRETIHPEDRPKAEQLVQDAARSATELNAEWRVRSRDGSVRWLMSRGRPVRDAGGQVVRYLGICVDITDRKRAEEALRQEDRRKSDFLGVLSHELRNPLAPIRNSTYILDHAPPGSVEAARAKAIITRQTEHLSRLVDDLLDVTRISRGKIELRRERIDVREIVRSTSEDLRTLFERGKIRLSVLLPPQPVWIDADSTRISQVVGNLLQNAAKFTPAPGAVSVVVEREGDTAVVRVSDSGVGMEPGLIAQVFEPFVQAERGLARSQGGLGLGLALARGLVELHGGTVSAASEGLGRGSELTIRLPLSPQPQVGAGQASRSRIAPMRSVLIIEDNVDAGRSLADVLELNGHSARVACDGRSGIAFALEMRPDFVLCDIGLPDIDGYEVARTLRADGALRSTRLIALSGYAQPRDKQRAREAGFDAHLRKPPSLDELQELLVGSMPPAPGPGLNARPPSPRPSSLPGVKGA